MGYVYEVPEQMGYYAEAPEFAGMGYVYETPDYVGEVPEQMGYVYEVPEVGAYAETPDQMGYVYDAPEQMGYFGENPDVAGYAEAPQDMGYFAEDPVEGYIRERDTSARVVPLENIGDVEGYYRPQTINPSVESFRPAEAGTSQPASTWFQPLW